MSAGTLAILAFGGLLTLLGSLVKYQEFLEHEAHGTPMSPSTDLTPPGGGKLIPDVQLRRMPVTSGNTKTDQDLFEFLQRGFAEIVEFLRTDGRPGVKPSGGIGWIALAFCFFLLSPIMVPLLLTPFVALFFLLLPLASIGMGGGER